jgi:hypothetical protein
MKLASLSKTQIALLKIFKTVRLQLKLASLVELNNLTKQHVLVVCTHSMLSVCVCVRERGGERERERERDHERVFVLERERKRRKVGELNNLIFSG